MVINIRNEVQAILGRAMTATESRKFKELRSCGYANPYDIVRAL